MSRQPSPGPSHQHIHSNASLYHPPGLVASPQFNQKQQKNRSYVAGITAGVEDVKYQAKYKELKKKVKEIENDNDRLYFKLLLAKKNIRRMNLERAILYERLAAVPPTPGRHTQDLPPEQDPLFHQQPPIPPEHALVIDPNDRALVEYMRSHPNARLVQGPDGRVVAVEDTPPTAGPGGAIMPQPPPHGLPLVHGFRHDSGPGYDPNRQLPPLPPMIPLIHAQPEPHPDMPPINDHHGPSYPPAQPHAYPHSHSSSSHQSRSNSARPDLDPLPGGTRIDTLPPAHAVRSRSPSMSGDVQGDRPRRHDIHELTHPHGHQLPHPHIQIPPQNMPASPSTRSPSSTRGSVPGRIHNHQRVGPGANINRDVREMSRSELEALREREREVERDHHRPRELARLGMEEQEEAGAWLYRDSEMVDPRMSHSASRSGSPASGPGNGGSRVPSRPSSGQALAYEVERARPKQRVADLLGSSREPGFDSQDDRGAAAARTSTAEMAALPLAMDSRRRSRGDGDLGDEYGGGMRSPIEGAASRASSGSGNALPESRGVKRLHPEDHDETPSPARDERMDEDV
ncbi:hypothetical protein AcW2_006035 [Taiwanofungus camphoratus]|nr:hypothetical protein AcW2_006035 [Antrodia cinnamomea]